MKNTVRTFIAIPTTPAVKAAAGELIEVLRSADADVKWVEPENLHLTVKFLGEVNLTETARICQAMAQAAAEVEPFEMELVGAGAFPTPSRARTLWLGSRGADASLGALHGAVEARLQKLGFRKEGRPFQAHLTLGRVRQGGPALAALGELVRQHAEYSAGPIRVGELVLYSSQLAPEGPVYHPLGRATLGRP